MSQNGIPCIPRIIKLILLPQGWPWNSTAKSGNSSTHSPATEYQLVFIFTLPFATWILPSIEECKPIGKNEPHDMTSSFYFVSFSESCHNSRVWPTLKQTSYLGFNYPAKFPIWKRYLVGWPRIHGQLNKNILQKQSTCCGKAVFFRLAPLPGDNKITFRKQTDISVWTRRFKVYVSIHLSDPFSIKATLFQIRLHTQNTATANVTWVRSELLGEFVKINAIIPPCLDTCYWIWKKGGTCGHMGVSENSGTPKSSILIGFSIIFTIHFGVPLFSETPI